MSAAVIILSAAACLLLLTDIRHRLEIKKIIKETERILSRDTLQLVHSPTGGYAELVGLINRLLSELQQNRALYAQKRHSLEQMITNISHDLKTPLTSALGYISIIRTQELSEQERERELDVIRKRLMRLNELINSFFELSKIISLNARPELSRVNVTELLENSAGNYYDDYCASGKSIALNAPRGRTELDSSENMLTRIFDNLIGNALKHGSGDLTIDLEKTEDGVKIVFSNPADCEGIDCRRIFDEFYTTELSRTKGGSGLGLAIAKQFTQILGGDISAQTRGDIFSVIIEF